jgi:hypothetical protein
MGQWPISLPALLFGCFCHGIVQFQGRNLTPIEDFGSKTVMCEEHSGLAHGF